MQKLTFKVNVSDTHIRVCKDDSVEKTIEEVREEYRYIDLVKQEDIALKDCPFCGSETYINESEGGEYFVHCKECSANMMDSMDWGSDKDLLCELIEKWNTRV